MMKEIKFGIEIEGRYKGLPSIFIHITNVDKFFEKYSNWLQKVIHFYILANEYPLSEVVEKIKEVKDKLPETYILTVDIDNIDIDIPDFIDHIIMNADTKYAKESIKKLRPTDTIKIYDNYNVYAITKENMYFTDGKLYDDDVIIDPGE